MHKAMLFAYLTAMMVLLAQSSPTLCAQGASLDAAKDKLPSGESIIKRYRDATRDKEKLKTVETIRMTGTMTLVDMGVSAPITNGEC